MSTMQRRPWLTWVVVALALVGLYLGLSGYAMVASFSVSNPEQLARWQRLALVYNGISLGSLATLIAAIVALVRRARRRSSLSAPAV